MRNNQTKKLCIASILCAVAVVGSMFSIPVFGSKCAPIQHMVNILCAVLLGPGYGVGVAFCASLIRNLLGIGSLMAFPGSMFGALLCGIMYWKTKNVPATLLAEVFGTAILGGFCAYPIGNIAYGCKCRRSGILRLCSAISDLNIRGSYPFSGVARGFEKVRRTQNVYGNVMNVTGRKIC